MIVTWGSFVIVLLVMGYFIVSDRNNLHESGSTWGWKTSIVHNLLFALVMVPVVWAALWGVSLL